MTKRFAPKPSGSEPSPSEPHFGLRFISGKYQGGEYALAEGQEITWAGGQVRGPRILPVVFP